MVALLSLDGAAARKFKRRGAVLLPLSRLPRLAPQGHVQVTAARLS